MPKCCSLTVQASSDRVYDPSLQLCRQTIPFISSSTFRSGEGQVCTAREVAHPTVKRGCYSADKSLEIEDL